MRHTQISQSELLRERVCLSLTVSIVTSRVTSDDGRLTRQFLRCTRETSEAVALR